MLPFSFHTLLFKAAQITQTGTKSKISVEIIIQQYERFQLESSWENANIKDFATDGQPYLHRSIQAHVVVLYEPRTAAGTDMDYM